MNWPNQKVKLVAQKNASLNTVVQLPECYRDALFRWLIPLMREHFGIEIDKAQGEIGLVENCATAGLSLVPVTPGAYVVFALMKGPMMYAGLKMTRVEGDAEFWWSIFQAFANWNKDKKR
jgi:hypothetical protein